MNMKRNLLLKRGAIATATLIIMVSQFRNSDNYTYKEIAVPAPVQFSPRLQTLFEKTKILCFGRYAIKLPQEAQLIVGSFWFPSGIDINSGNVETAKRLAEDKIKKLKWENDTAEIIYNGPGPINGSWQLRYFENKYYKENNSIFFNTYITKGNIVFTIGDAIEKGESENIVIARQLERAKSLRLRAAEEESADPGFCIEHGFFHDDQYKDQEMVSAGIYLPSFPDITFSISSNKDAYADYSKDEFEIKMRSELSLLARIKSAQQTQGIFYPKRDVLREGKRAVQHWKGEESLIRRADGTHDFEWAFVGTPKDVANPSEFNVVMFTKVEDNIVGAAKMASVSNDEAVALWDKLLSGLKFRVKVPGAPEGSYFMQPDASNKAISNQ